ncbi:DNA primase [soil metagenome]
MAGDTVSQIKERLDVVDLVGSKVQLRQAGRNFKGLCPFHTEKTPSFVVFPESQSYHCFGCGKSGDIFSFMMDTENLDFGDTLKQLAQRANVEITSVAARDPERDAHRERLIELNERAGSFFSSVLWTSALGEPARALLEQRGVDRQTAERFGLGFAPDSFDALRNHLLRRGDVDQDVLLEAGLQSKNDSGRVYDRFRNRVMFPIRERSGRTIGFGARALGDEMPKYLNSPQTPIFNKSDALYAVDRAEEAIRRERTLVVVEGYMDAIAAHQFGFSNVVASMGTALTSQQVGSIRRYVDRVFLALDADAAGQMATLRAIDSVRESFSDESAPTVGADTLVRFERALAAEVRIVLLEGGKDPDELIRSDPDTWRRALDRAIPLVEYVLNIKLRDIERTPAARAKALREDVVPVLREINDQAVLAHYVGVVARLLEYKDTDVRAALRAGRSQGARAVQVQERPAAGDPERHLVQLLLQYPLTTTAQDEAVQTINLDDVLDARNREILRVIIAGESLNETMESLPDEIAQYAQFLRDETSRRSDVTPGLVYNELVQAIQKLSKTRYEVRVKQVNQELAVAKAAGNSDEVLFLLHQMVELATKKSKYDPAKSPYFTDSRTAKV